MSKQGQLGHIHPFQQFLLLMGFTFVMMFLSSIVLVTAVLISGYKWSDIQALAAHPEQIINITIIVQMAYSVLTFLIPALILGYLVSGSTIGIPQWRGKGAWYNYLLPALVLICCGIFVQALVINKDISSFNNEIAEMIKSARNSQEAAEIFIDRAIDIPSPFMQCMVFLMIALFPAVCEEFFFRGTMQEIFQKWFKNPHLAIVATGIIFGVIHFELFNFFAISLMGIILGYLYYITKNLWVSILCHFLNNGLTYLLLLLSKRQMINFDPNGQIPIYITILAGVLMMVFITLLARINERKRGSLEESL